MTGALHRKRLRQALDLKRAGKLSEAEERLDTLVAAMPDFAEAWLELARIRLDRVKAREAFDAFNRAAGFIETAAAARLSLGRLARPGAGDSLREWNFRIALLIEPALVPALTDLADLRPQAVLAWHAVAAAGCDAGADPYRELINRGWLARAIKLARIVAVVRPGTLVSERHLAVLAFHQEDLETRARHLKQAAALKPDDVEAQMQATDGLFQSERFAEAEIHARRAFALNEKNAAAMFWLGRVERRLGGFAKAEATLARTVQADPDFGLRVQVVRQGVHPDDFRP